MRLMRASIRGSKRRVIVVDSRLSALWIDALISRPSSRASAQKAASSSSVSKCGNSVQAVMTFILGSLCHGVFAIEESLFLRRHVARKDGAVAFSVGPEDCE